MSGPPLGGVVAAPGPESDHAAAWKASREPPPAATGPGQPAADAAGGEALEKLKALGYIGGAEPGGVRPTGSTRTAGSFNNAGVILKSQGKALEAAAAFEEALRLEPGLASAEWNLSDLLFGVGSDGGRADELLLRAVAGGLPAGERR